MKHHPWGVTALALTALVSAIAVAPASSAQPHASPELVAALQRVRAVKASFVIAWSSHPQPPQNAGDAVSVLKRQILALHPDDRAAMLFWLRAHGRDALHQRGVTDVEIGPPLYPVDYTIAWVPLPDGFVNPTPIPTATPPPATPRPQAASRPRGIFGFIAPLALQALAAIPPQTTKIASSSHSETHMEGNALVTTSHSTSVTAGVDVGGLAGMLAKASLEELPAPQAAAATRSTAKQWLLLEFGRQREESDPSGIAVDNGVAGIRKNSEGAACLGFTNRNSRAVREIDFDLTLVDARDRFLQTVALRRTGHFAPNERSEAPHDVTAAAVAREDANCVTLGSAAPNAPAASPFSRTAAMAYAVRRVIFDNGGEWLRPGANRWPQEFSS